MSGLDQIIAQILADAETEAEGIRKKAKDEADALLKEEQERIRKLQDEAEKTAERKRSIYLERVKSSADLKRRQAVLETKQEMIAQVLQAAYETLLSEDTESYFSLLTKLLEHFVREKEGEIYFSQRDLERMPDSFREVIQKTAREKGGSLRLGAEPKQIDGGFILAYGGIEENCTFRALFAEKKELLADEAHAMLFG